MKAKRGEALAKIAGVKTAPAESSPDLGTSPDTTKIDAAQELIDSVVAKDAEGVALAFKALYAACRAEHEDEDSEETY